jgi:sugar phosphate isomerase/epimerase
MAKTGKIRSTPLIPEPAVLRKALAKSARDANKLAKAFGVRVAVEPHRATLST